MEHQNMKTLYMMYFALCVSMMYFVITEVLHVSHASIYTIYTGIHLYQSQM